jgi:hypothetical protein
MWIHLEEDLVQLQLQYTLWFHKRHDISQLAELYRVLKSHFAAQGEFFYHIYHFLNVCLSQISSKPLKNSFTAL